MSGHSHWSTIKRKKSAADAKRGKLFTRLAREIAVSAREGGGDPDINYRLQYAIDRARSHNMPKDNIDRAIKRGTGESTEGGQIEEISYEGYASSGIALMISCMTDNRNRAVSDLRHVLNKNGGSLADGGSVAWQFTRSAYFALPVEGLNEDEVFELAVEAGADDVIFDEEAIEIIAPAEAYKEISDRLSDSGIKPEEAELRMMPNNEVEINQEDAIKVLKIIEALEELDDVQNVYSNLSLTDEVMAQLEVS